MGFFGIFPGPGRRLALFFWGEMWYTESSKKICEEDALCCSK